MNTNSARKRAHYADRTLREGYPDVEEYWSFCLPPERAKAFLTAYVDRAKLPLVEVPSEIPDFVLGSKGQREWDNRYWFNGFDELDQVYLGS